MDKLKYYEFSRGEKFKCVLAVAQDGRYFVMECTPNITSTAIQDRLIDDAEKAVEEYRQKYESGNG